MRDYSSKRLKSLFILMTQLVNIAGAWNYRFRRCLEQLVYVEAGELRHWEKCEIPANCVGVF